MKSPATWLGTPYYATVTTVLAVVAGMLGSVYSREIALAFPLSWGTYEGISLRAVAFWCSLLVFALLFFGRQMHEERARHELIVGTDTIQKQIQTLPPKGFRTKFAQVALATHRALARDFPRTLPPDTQPEDLALMIRSLLQSIATLAVIFDDDPAIEDRPAIYSANIMLFVKRAAHEPFFFERSVGGYTLFARRL